MEPPGQADLLAPAGPGPVPDAELRAGPVGARFGIYVHCPFCRTKCPYCDFNVAIHREDRIAPYVAGLRAELQRYALLPWAGRVPAGSLFFGGGTPSLLPPEAVAAVLADARDGLGLAPDAEVTLEANPEGLDRDRLRAFRAAGVTRLSLGVQTLDDALLRRLGRTHSAAEAEAAYRAARAAGFDDVSVDLLYACPDQDLAAWARTLDAALAWEPDHLSAYALTLEPATPFGRARPRGCPPRTSRWPSSRRSSSARRARGSRATRSRTSRAGAGVATTSSTGGARTTWASAPRRTAPSARSATGPRRSEPLARRRARRELDPRGLGAAVGRPDPRRAPGPRAAPRGRRAARVARAPPGRRAAPRRAEPVERYLAAGVMTTRDERIALTDRGVLVSDAIFAELV